MAKKKKIEDKVMVLEFHIWMHCNGCEKTIAKAISKIKGVEKFTTNMIKHRVVVTGRIDPEKVAKKIKKKTGKIVEILSKKEDKKETKKDGDGDDDSTSQQQILHKQFLNSLLLDYVGHNDIYTIFSDENANACSIM